MGFCLKNGYVEWMQPKAGKVLKVVYRSTAHPAVMWERGDDLSLVPAWAGQEIDSGPLNAANRGLDQL